MVFVIAVSVDDADNRLAMTTMGRVERCGSVFEGVYLSDDWTQPSLSKPELQCGKPRAIGFDDEKDSLSVVGLDSRWCARGSNGWSLSQIWTVGARLPGCPMHG